MSDNKVQAKKIYCNSCKQTTNHLLKGEHRWAVVDPQGYWEELTYKLYICAGCETGTMETRWTASVNVDQDGEQIYDSSYSPKRAHADLVHKRFVKLEPRLARIYRETIKCYNDGSLVLCTAGLRSLLEGVCEDKRIPGKSLRTKIDGLERLLSNKAIVRSLHHFRFTGNKAVHKLEAPETRDVKLAIEVMEDLLNFLYELDYKASRLRRDTSKRKLPPRVTPSPSS